nr:5-formyltetrahydrofolate cyclo-ligase [Pseudenhygromyxa sp. WMMC2535]
MRREMLARRRELMMEDLQEASHAMTEAVRAHAWWQEARGVAAFVGVRGEPDTRALLAATLAAGKQLWLPRVLGKGRMCFWQLDELESLQEGRMGLLEPPARGEGIQAPGPADGVDLVLVPGLAFDLRGARLGFGAGHYDRAFGPQREAGEAMAKRCGMCLSPFVLDPGVIPMQVHDIRMNAVVTEHGWSRRVEALGQPSEGAGR